MAEEPKLILAVCVRNVGCHNLVGIMHRLKGNDFVGEPEIIVDWMVSERITRVDVKIPEESLLVDSGVSIYVGETCGDKGLLLPDY